MGDAMQEEMQQFNQSSSNWKSVPLPGHRQEKGIDYDEELCTSGQKRGYPNCFWHLLFLYGFSGISLDVKMPLLLREKLKKKCNVTRQKDLKILYFPTALTEWDKALYDFIKHHAEPGMQDCLLFCYNTTTEEVYVDDIIFGSTNKAWCDEFEVKQLPDGLFISQDKYVKDMLTKFDMESVRTATTPYEAAKTKLKDETDPPVNLEAYSDTIYAGSHGDKEIHYSGCHFWHKVNFKAVQKARLLLVSAGCTMVLLVVILPAGRMVSAGWSMVLLDRFGFFCWFTMVAKSMLAGNSFLLIGVCPARLHGSADWLTLFCCTRHLVSFSADSIQS
ncbi:hypothetical protein Tco_1182187 [Tanacetum coccineum]